MGALGSASTFYVVSLIFNLTGTLENAPESSASEIPNVPTSPSSIVSIRSCASVLICTASCPMASSIDEDLDDDAVAAALGEAAQSLGRCLHDMGVQQDPPVAWAAMLCISGYRSKLL